MELTTETVQIGFADLEGFIRVKVQGLIQRILEAEVTELLCRSKGSRVAPDGPAAYRNGHGKNRRLSTSIGTITVRRPRVRGSEAHFVSRVLPLFARHTAQVGELLPQLYLHGLASGDFALAMRGLLGEGAPLSASSIARLRAGWQAEYTAWHQRDLRDLDVVYLWVDGIYVKAGLEKDKAALLVLIGACADGSKHVLAVESGQRESEASWSAVLRDLKSRGMNCPRLVIGDGHLGIWAALSSVLPEAGQQRCWNHRLRNVLDCVGRKKQAEAKMLLTKVMYAPTLKQAKESKGIFEKWARGNQYIKAAEAIDKDWERMTAYYSLPKEHWVHLRTPNIVESPFASVRLRTGASKRYKKVEGASAMIWKLLMVAEKTFRKLRSPEIMAEVHAGARYADGLKVQLTQEPPQQHQMAA